LRGNQVWRGAGDLGHGKVDIRLPGKGNSNSHGARPVHRIITMIKWFRNSRLSIKNSLSGAREVGFLPHLLLRRSLKLSPSKSHIFKTVYQELCPSDGRGRHIAANGRRPCEGARRCQAFICRRVATFQVIGKFEREGVGDLGHGRSASLLQSIPNASTLSPQLIKFTMPQLSNLLCPNYQIYYAPTIKFTMPQLSNLLCPNYQIYYAPTIEFTMPQLSFPLTN